ncbi:MAG: High-affinity branched-chain amino acid transport ATP-binding protein LivF [Alphaproteobacteria bacterium MarineAlpha2_Bin1]|nr:MAG: High-affinity branched-chain amino acid transport ATP-binding protein LivF [Alphaproteobacteria bacterium MarineAlpha2_Bin1]
MEQNELNNKILSIDNIYGGYGGVNILNGISLHVKNSEIVVIIGPNGSGKSTTMKSICGLVDINSGSIIFKGKEISNMRTDKITSFKIGYVPQENNIFSSLSVEENLEMGAYSEKKGKYNLKNSIERIYKIFPPLKDKQKQAAINLSGGQRQMVAIGRALMLDPDLLLLDEPTAGLSPKFTQLIFDKIVEINNLGVSILMVEQNAKEALSFADRAYVLVMGKNRFEDTGENLLNSEEIGKMFLGG